VVRALNSAGVQSFGSDFPTSQELTTVRPPSSNLISDQYTTSEIQTDSLISQITTLKLSCFA